MTQLNIKFAKVDENELLNIWDMFTDEIVEDKHTNPNDEVMLFLENTIVEMASGNEINLQINETLANVLEIFVNHFEKDGETYYFRFKNIIAEGRIL